ncbi:MAG: hypothetical protein U1C74_08550 [Phenylobacterium sp.]|nr:hypothetical protein [Phenylobacterium sp.]
MSIPRLTTTAALGLAALVLTGCATSGTGRDVVAVVQDEEARQAVAGAADDTGDADDALSAASDAEGDRSEPPMDR